MPRPPRHKPARFARPRRRHAGSWREAFAAMRWWLLAIVVVAGALVWRWPELVGAPGLWDGEREDVTTRFALSSEPGYAPNCVVDGDTIRMGERTIRLIGVDTAERDAACEAEAALAQVATLALQRWLNRGPFAMTESMSEPTRDRYGRDLRVLWRNRPDGTRDEAAVYLREEAGARGYGGGGREGWC